MIWKLITAIVNRGLAETINLHDALHGFREDGGVVGKYGTTDSGGEADPLVPDLLDLRKAHTKRAKKHVYAYFLKWVCTPFHPYIQKSICLSIVSTFF